MKGNPDVVELLNEVLTAELTAINQYYVHYKMLENWGYGRLASVKRKESIEEMQHADKVIERILYLDGIPNMQRLSPVKVGENPIEMNEVDLALERNAVERLNRGITIATQAADNGTRALLEHILTEEESAIDFLEAHLQMVKDMGRENYLAQIMTIEHS